MWQVTRHPPPVQNIDMEIWWLHTLHKNTSYIKYNAATAIIKQGLVQSSQSPNAPPKFSEDSTIFSSTTLSALLFLSLSTKCQWNPTEQPVEIKPRECHVPHSKKQRKNISELKYWPSCSLCCLHLQTPFLRHPQFGSGHHHHSCTPGLLRYHHHPLVTDGKRHKGTDVRKLQEANSIKGS